MQSKKKNVSENCFDTGDDYAKFDNSPEGCSISSIDSSSNNMDLNEISQNFEDIEDQNVISYDRQEKNDR